jgi:hypothetical protein
MFTKKIPFLLLAVMILFFASSCDGLNGEESETESEREISVEDTIFENEFFMGDFIYNLDNILGYWSFNHAVDEKVTDLTGKGNDVLLGELSLSDEGLRGRSLRLSTEGQALITNQGDLWGSDQFTINFWVRLERSPDTTAAFMTKASSAPYDFRLYLTNTGGTYTFSSEKVSWYGEFSNQKIWGNLDRNILKDRWVMLTLTYDGRYMVSYIDGVLSTRNRLDAGSFHKSSSMIYLGSETQYDIPGMEGWLDELLIADKALKGDEVASLLEAYNNWNPNKEPEIKPAGIQTLTADSSQDITASYPEYQSPLKEFRQIQYSMGTTPQTTQLEEWGMGGVTLAAFNQNYMNENHDWEKLISDLRVAVNAGFNIWLYDEDLYPSGAASGLTVKDHPEYEVSGIYELRFSGIGTEDVQVDLPFGANKFVAAVFYPVTEDGIDYAMGQSVPVMETAIHTKGIGDDWVLCYYVQRYLSDNHTTENRSDLWQAGAKYPNLLSYDACKRYIDLTHQQYKNRFGELFDQIEAFYTGEPALVTHSRSTSAYKVMHWEDSIPAAFKAMHGYDLFPHLGEIFSTPTGVFNTSRMHYYQTIGNLYTENFFKQYALWCETNGAALSGHLLAEEIASTHVPLYGDFLQVSSWFQIAGYDHYVLSHGNDPIPNILAARFAFSPVRHRGNYAAQSLFEPIVTGYYDEKSPDAQTIHPDLSVYRSNTNLMIANGVNRITNYAPYIQYKQEEYRKYMDYQARLNYLLRGARDQARVAVYYNIETFQGRYAPNTNGHYGTVANKKPFDDLNNEHKAIFRTLFNENIGANFLGRYDFELVSIEQGSLSIGEYEYDVIILPSMDIIPLDVLEKITHFQNTGGMVIWYGKIPQTGAYESENTRVAELLNEAVSLEDPSGLAELLNAKLVKNIQIEADNPERIYYTEFVGDLTGEGKEGEVYFIANDSYLPNEIRVSHATAQKAVIFEPYEGKVFEVSLPFTITVGEYSGIVVSFP